MRQPKTYHGIYYRHAFILVCSVVVHLSAFSQLKQDTPRRSYSLDGNWQTSASEKLEASNQQFYTTGFKPNNWKAVTVPHNWDAYEGYRRMLHGNRHGYAWYRRSFRTSNAGNNKRYFLYFEGVGSYATVWLNGKQVGTHAGGRTGFTIDITNTIKLNAENLLAVRSDHPSGIRDLPWVCGGCSDERGFSEGSQPMGIFRPVHLVVTSDIRATPFGLHAWNDTTISAQQARLYSQLEIRSYRNTGAPLSIRSRLIDERGVTITTSISSHQLKSGAAETLALPVLQVEKPQLWSTTHPYCYTLKTEIWSGNQLLDVISTSYGFRTIRWPSSTGSSKQFFLNDTAVFINGIAEYEHLVGGSHAFSTEQIRARALQIRAAGFNAFRDAHHPHNLRYQQYWDSLGILWWTQMGAHVWYDSPAFRKNFKNLLVEWVRERRNSPSLVLWGLQNESKLPKDFAEECTRLIRSLDPTTSSQRLVTTCNGGEGTDWDVPQNWTGTYGGDPKTYGADLKRQVLIGEYGAWRTLDLHAEGEFKQNGAYTEERFCQLMETKIRLGEEAHDSSSGHFMWLLTSHDNPGRVQGGEAWRANDRIGPVNYKGLLTPWEEPLDAFYLYRSNYADPLKEPMVYLVSHTWPSRVFQKGKLSEVIVYSNCSEVELFDKNRNRSFGKKKRGGIGTHFTWNDVNIENEELVAIGYRDGRAVAADSLIFPLIADEEEKSNNDITSPRPGLHYLLRVNCGGDDYKDAQGHTWLADRHLDSSFSWGSVSWTDAFKKLPPYFASQRRSFDKVAGTSDDPLFQSFRYGREALQYQFRLPNGSYEVELFFMEPWWGRGSVNAKGFRVFDIALNRKTVLKDFDIYKEAGTLRAVKKTFRVTVTDNRLIVHFPNIAAGQAVISAIAIATQNAGLRLPEKKSHSAFVADTSQHWKRWLDLTDATDPDGSEKFLQLSPSLFGADVLQATAAHSKAVVLKFIKEADLFLAVDSNSRRSEWLKDFSATGELVRTTKPRVLHVFRKRMVAGERFELPASGGDRPIVMIQPASDIEPAYDLKKITSYKAASARFTGNGISIQKVDGKDRVLMQKGGRENFVEFSMEVGVADIYSLTLSYNNPSTEIFTGKMLFRSADGTLMKEETLSFTPTREGKNNYIITNTGSMINAGSYKVQVYLNSDARLLLNALDVQ